MSDHDAANILLVKEVVPKYPSTRPRDLSDCAFGGNLLKELLDMVVKYRLSNDSLLFKRRLDALHATVFLSTIGFED